MVGPILVFLSVCAIVAIYMSIVHSFLRSSEKDVEEPERDSEPELIRYAADAESEQPHRGPREQWAH